MAFITKGRKEDLRRLAWEMGLVMAEDLRILEIKQLILRSEGNGFFTKSWHIVLNLRHRNWSFSDSPRRTYNFVKEIIIQEVQSRLNLEENTCLLREDEGKCLTPEQRNELGTLLNLYGTVFEPGGDSTSFIVPRINSGDNYLVSVTLNFTVYRNSGAASSPIPFSQSPSIKSNYSRGGSLSYVGSIPTICSSGINRTVTPASLGTPYRYTDPAYSTSPPRNPLLSPKDRSLSPITLRTINHNAFADDLAVVTTGKARRTLEIETNSILDQISNKLKNLKLVISPEKTYSVAFRCTARGGTVFRRKPIFKINNVTIKVVNSIKYLGLIIDNRLS
ncbi:uncharacterized protein TNCT_599831 [Trichonephila clavata]|uniref:Reverse transcriptase domain-containing protein n=1 Tax=Trichonephila clavata TaxID=2740835 RepID=A0A8X6FTY1_TRICU|nr:uncharacterized protein TNCT_599831 [Trichonephila clavata]